MPKNLADQDPDRIVSVNEACPDTWHFQADIIPAWRRRAAHSAEPGRVGYRVGDLLAFIRASAERRVRGRTRGNTAPPPGSSAPLPRPDVSAEEPGIVEPVKVTPDTICGSVAGDPDVREADARLDRATPSTHRELVAARLAAQARLGIPAAERAPLYSGEVEDYLVPVMVRMGHGDEAAVVVYLRRELTRLYGEFGETVLSFMLRTYRHGGTEALLEAAMATAAAA